MHIVIIGAGNVGYSIARILSGNHTVMVVERDERRYEYVMNSLNVGVINANGASPQVIKRVLRDDIDIFLAVTDSDETNFFACSIAKRIKPTVVAVARMRDFDYLGGGPIEDLIDVDHVLSPEYLIASKIRRIATLENAIDVDRVPGHDLEIAKFRLSNNQKGIASISLKSLVVPKGCKVLCIHRNKEVIIPQDSDTLQGGDEVVVIGTEGGILAFDRILGSVKSPRDMLIVGGGIVTQYLVEMFEADGLSIRLIERDEARCKELARRFSKTIVINDNGSDPLVLHNENVGMTDVLICATKSEEGNLLACLVGKHLGVPKTITTYTKQEYRGIFQMAGIDSAISYHEVVANEVVKATVPNRSLMFLNGFKEQLMSVMVTPRCRVHGKKLGQAKLPERSTIAAVVFDNNVTMPNPDAYIMEGDTLFIYADIMDVSVLERIFNTHIPMSP